jgi:hypothetical protein
MRLIKGLSIILMVALLFSQISVAAFASSTVSTIKIHYEGNHDDISSVDVEIDRSSTVSAYFHCEVLGSSGNFLEDETVSWSLADNDNGSSVILSPIDGRHVKIVISKDAAEDTFYLTATSDADSSITSQLAINLIGTNSVIITGDSEVYINRSGESSYDYTAKVLDSNGVETDGEVEWELTSSLSGVTIDSTGTLKVSTNAEEGRVTIKATSVADSSVFDTKNVEVTLNPAEVVNSITITGNDTIVINRSGNVSSAYTAKVKNSLGQILSNEDVTWELYDTYEGVTISNSGVVTVSKTAEEGYIVVKAISATDNSIYSNKMVQLVNPTSSETPEASSIEISGAESVYIDPDNNTTAQYTATVKDQFNNEMPSETVSWELKDAYAGVSINSSGLLTVSKSTFAGTIGIIATLQGNSSVKNVLYVNLTKTQNSNPSDPRGDSQTVAVIGTNNITTNKYGSYLGVYYGVLKDSSGNIIEDEHVTLRLTSAVSGVRLYRVSPTSNTNYKYYLECTNLSSDKTIVIEATSVSNSSISSQFTVNISSYDSDDDWDEDEEDEEEDEDTETEEKEPEIVDAKIDRKIQPVGVEDTPLAAIMQDKDIDAKQETNWDSTIKVTANLDTKNVSKILESKKEAKELIVPMQYKADEFVVEITSEAFQLLKDNEISLAISTENVKLTVPTDIINFLNLSKALRCAEKDIKISLKVKSVSMAEQDIMLNSAVDKKPITNIFNFQITAADQWGNELEVYDFGDKKVRGEFLYDEQDIGDVEDLNKLNVYKYNEETKEWEYRKSQLDAERSKVIFYTSTFSNYAIFEYSPSFVDLENHWAKKNVELMASKNIINGTGFGIFHPEGTITRAEFVALIVRALDLSGEASHNFIDVPRMGWYNNIVGLALKHGLISEDSTKEFRPNTPITREEMAVIIMKSYSKLTGDSSLSGYSGIDFGDIKEVSSWALDSVKKASSLGIVKGSYGNFYPRKTATRAEGATMIYRLLEVTGNL